MKFGVSDILLQVGDKPIDISSVNSLQVSVDESNESEIKEDSEKSKVWQRTPGSFTFTMDVSGKKAKQMYKYFFFSRQPGRYANLFKRAGSIRKAKKYSKKSVYTKFEVLRKFARTIGVIVIKECYLGNGESPYYYKQFFIRTKRDRKWLRSSHN